MAYFSDETLKAMGAVYDEVCGFFPAEWVQVREDVARYIVLLVKCGQLENLKERVLGCLSDELSTALH
jgi:hypothetical protein